MLVPPVSAERWSPDLKSFVITTEAHASVVPAASETVSEGESVVLALFLMNAAFAATLNTRVELGMASSSGQRLVRLNPLIFLIYCSAPRATEQCAVEPEFSLTAAIQQLS